MASNHVITRDVQLRVADIDMSDFISQVNHMSNELDKVRSNVKSLDTDLSRAIDNGATHFSSLRNEAKTFSDEVDEVRLDMARFQDEFDKRTKAYQHTKDEINHRISKDVGTSIGGGSNYGYELATARKELMDWATERRRQIGERAASVLTQSELLGLDRGTTRTNVGLKGTNPFKGMFDINALRTELTSYSDEVVKEIKAWMPQFTSTVNGLINTRNSPLANGLNKIFGSGLLGNNNPVLQKKYTESGITDIVQTLLGKQGPKGALLDQNMINSLTRGGTDLAPITSMLKSVLFGTKGINNTSAFIKSRFGDITFTDKYKSMAEMLKGTALEGFFTEGNKSYSGAFTDRRFALNDMLKGMIANDNTVLSAVARKRLLDEMKGNSILTQAAIRTKSSAGYNLVDRTASSGFAFNISSINDIERLTQELVRDYLLRINGQNVKNKIVNRSGRGLDLINGSEGISDLTEILTANNIDSNKKRDVIRAMSRSSSGGTASEALRALNVIWEIANTTQFAKKTGSNTDTSAIQFMMNDNAREKQDQYLVEKIDPFTNVDMVNARAQKKRDKFIADWKAGKGSPTVKYNSNPLNPNSDPIYLSRARFDFNNPDDVARLNDYFDNTPGYVFKTASKDFKINGKALASRYEPMNENAITRALGMNHLNHNEVTDIIKEIDLGGVLSAYENDKDAAESALKDILTQVGVAEIGEGGKFLVNGSKSKYVLAGKHGTGEAQTLRLIRRAEYEKVAENWKKLFANPFEQYFGSSLGEFWNNGKVAKEYNTIADFYKDLDHLNKMWSSGVDMTGGSINWLAGKTADGQDVTFESLMRRILSPGENATQFGEVLSLGNTDSAVANGGRLPRMALVNFQAIWKKAYDQKKAELKSQGLADEEINAELARLGLKEKVFGFDSTTEGQSYINRDIFRAGTSQVRGGMAAKGNLQPIDDIARYFAQLGFGTTTKLDDGSTRYTASLPSAYSDKETVDFISVYDANGKKVGVNYDAAIDVSMQKNKGNFVDVYKNNIGKDNNGRSAQDIANQALSVYYAMAPMYEMNRYANDGMGNNIGTQAAQWIQVSPLLAQMQQEAIARRIRSLNYLEGARSIAGENNDLAAGLAGKAIRLNSQGVAEYIPAEEYYLQHQTEIQDKRNDYIESLIRDAAGGKILAFNDGLNEVRNAKNFNQIVREINSENPFSQYISGIQNGRVVTNPYMSYLESLGITEQSVNRDYWTQAMNLMDNGASASHAFNILAQKDNIKNNVGNNGLNTLTEDQFTKTMNTLMVARNQLNDSLKENFSPEEVLGILTLKGFGKEGTDRYLGEGIIDFDNYESMFETILRSPTGENQFVSRINYSFLRDVLRKINPDFKQSGVFMNLKDMQQIAGADWDGDMVKQILSNKYNLKEIRKNLGKKSLSSNAEKFSWLIRKNGLQALREQGLDVTNTDPKMQSIVDDFARTEKAYKDLGIFGNDIDALEDFVDKILEVSPLDTSSELVKENGKINTGISTFIASVLGNASAPVHMGAGSGIGSRLTSLDIYNPNNKLWAQMAAEANHIYDLYTTEAKRPIKIKLGQRYLSSLGLGAEWGKIQKLVADAGNYSQKYKDVEDFVDSSGRAVDPNNIVRFELPDGTIANAVYTDNGLLKTSSNGGFMIDTMQFASRNNVSNLTAANVMSGLEKAGMMRSNVADFITTSLLAEAKYDVDENGNIKYDDKGNATRIGGGIGYGFADWARWENGDVGLKATKALMRYNRWIKGQNAGGLNMVTSMEQEMLARKLYAASMDELMQYSAEQVANYGVNNLMEVEPNYNPGDEIYDDLKNVKGTQEKDVYSYAMYLSRKAGLGSMATKYGLRMTNIGGRMGTLRNGINESDLLFMVANQEEDPARRALAGQLLRNMSGKGDRLGAIPEDILDVARNAGYQSKFYTSNLLNPEDEEVGQILSILGIDKDQYMNPSARQTAIDRLTRKAMQEAFVATNDTNGPRLKNVENPYEYFKVFAKNLLDEGVATFWDTETSGLEQTKDQIVEIAGTKIKLGEGIIKGIDEYINPDMATLNQASFDRAAAITGITMDKLNNAEGRDKVLPKFMEFIGNGLVGGHNIDTFDNLVLDTQNRLAGIQEGYTPEYGRSLDTLKLVRMMMADKYKINGKDINELLTDSGYSVTYENAYKKAIEEGKDESEANIIAARTAGDLKGRPMATLSSLARMYGIANVGAHGAETDTQMNAFVALSALGTMLENQGFDSEAVQFKQTAELVKAQLRGIDTADAVNLGDYRVRQSDVITSANTKISNAINSINDAEDVTELSKEFKFANKLYEIQGMMQNAGRNLPATTGDNLFMSALSDANNVLTEALANGQYTQALEVARRWQNSVKTIGSGSEFDKILKEAETLNNQILNETRDGLEAEAKARGELAEETNGESLAQFDRMIQERAAEEAKRDYSNTVLQVDGNGIAREVTGTMRLFEEADKYAKSMQQINSAANKKSHKTGDILNDTVGALNNQSAGEMYGINKSIEFYNMVQDMYKNGTDAEKERAAAVMKSDSYIRLGQLVLGANGQGDIASNYMAAIGKDAEITGDSYAAGISDIVGKSKADSIIKKANALKTLEYTTEAKYRNTMSQIQKIQEDENSFKKVRDQIADNTNNMYYASGESNDTIYGKTKLDALKEQAQHLKDQIDANQPNIDAIMKTYDISMQSIFTDEIDSYKNMIDPKDFVDKKRDPKRLSEQRYAQFVQGIMQTKASLQEVVDSTFFGSFDEDQQKYYTDKIAELDKLFTDPNTKDKIKTLAQEDVDKYNKLDALQMEKALYAVDMSWGARNAIHDGVNLQLFGNNKKRYANDIENFNATRNTTDFSFADLRMRQNHNAQYWGNNPISNIIRSNMQYTNMLENNRRGIYSQMNAVQAEMIKYGANGTEQNAEKYDNAKLRYDQLNKQMKANIKEQQNWSGFSGLLKGAGGMMLGSGITMAYQAISKVLKAIISEVKKFAAEWENAMAGVSAKSGLTGEELESIGNTIKSQAVELRTSAVQLAKVYKQLFSSGYDTSNIEAAAAAVTKFATVTGQDATKAIKQLSLAINSGLSVSLEDAMDKLTAISDLTVASSSDITKVLQKMGATATATGMTDNETIAIATMLAESGGGNAANANDLGIILNRLTGISSVTTSTKEKWIDPTTGIEYDVSNLKSLEKTTGINFLAGNSLDTLNNSFDILKQIAEVWQDLSDAQRASITSVVGKDRQSNTFNQLMNYWSVNQEEIDTYLNALENSKGTVDTQYSTMVDTAAGAKQEAISNFENWIQSDYIQAARTAFWDIVSGIFGEEQPKVEVEIVPYTKEEALDDAISDIQYAIDNFTDSEGKLSTTGKSIAVTAIKELTDSFPELDKNILSSIENIDDLIAAIEMLKNAKDNYLEENKQTSQEYIQENSGSINKDLHSLVSKIYSRGYSGFNFDENSLALFADENSELTKAIKALYYDGYLEPDGSITREGSYPVTYAALTRSYINSWKKNGKTFDEITNGDSFIEGTDVVAKIIDKYYTEMTTPGSPYYVSSLEEYGYSRRNTNQIEEDREEIYNFVYDSLFNNIGSISGMTDEVFSIIVKDMTTALMDAINGSFESGYIFDTYMDVNKLVYKHFYNSNFGKYYSNENGTESFNSSAYLNENKSGNYYYEKDGQIYQLAGETPQIAAKNFAAAYGGTADEAIKYIKDTSTGQLALPTIEDYIKTNILSENTDVTMAQKLLEGLSTYGYQGLLNSIYDAEGNVWNTTLDTFMSNQKNVKTIMDNLINNNGQSTIADLYTELTNILFGSDVKTAISNFISSGQEVYGMMDIAAKLMDDNGNITYDSLTNSDFQNIFTFLGIDQGTWNNYTERDKENALGLYYNSANNSATTYGQNVTGYMNNAFSNYGITGFNNIGQLKYLIDTKLNEAIETNNQAGILEMTDALRLYDFIANSMAFSVNDGKIVSYTNAMTNSIDDILTKDGIDYTKQDNSKYLRELLNTKDIETTIREWGPNSETIQNALLAQYSGLEQYLYYRKNILILTEKDKEEMSKLEAELFAQANNYKSSTLNKYMQISDETYGGKLEKAKILSSYIEEQQAFNDATAVMYNEEGNLDINRYYFTDKEQRSALSKYGINDFLVRNYPELAQQILEQAVADAKAERAEMRSTGDTSLIEAANKAEATSGDLLYSENETAIIYNLIEALNNGLTPAVLTANDEYMRLIENNEKASEAMQGFIDGTEDAAAAQYKLSKAFNKTQKDINSEKKSLRSLSTEALNYQYYANKKTKDMSTTEQNKVAEMLGFSSWKQAVAHGITFDIADADIEDLKIEGLEDLRDGVNEMIGEEFRNEQGEAVFKTEGVKIQMGDAQILDANTDVETLTMLEERERERIKELLSLGYEFRAHVNQMFDENGQLVGEQLVIDNATIGASAVNGVKKTSGGSGGKSASEKLVQKWKRKTAVDKHYVNMVKAQEEGYKDAGQLASYNNMIELENVAQKRQIKTYNVAISALKKQLKSVKSGSDDYYTLTDAILEYEEAIADCNNTIAANTRLLKENRQAMRQARKDVEDMLESAFEENEQYKEDMLAGTVDMQNLILDTLKQRYQDEWDLVKEDLNKKREALEEEKELINERLEARKEAEDSANDYTEISRLQNQLALLSLDKSAAAEAEKVRTELAERQSALAWKNAEEIAAAQSDAIQSQIDGIDEYIEAEDERVAEYLEDAKNFATEVNEVLQLSSDNLLNWLKENVQSYNDMLIEAQDQQVNTWEDMYNKMMGITITYWDEVDSVIQGGLESVILTMQNLSQKYQNETATGKLMMLYDWYDKFDSYTNAFTGTKISESYSDYMAIIEKAIDSGNAEIMQKYIDGYTELMQGTAEYYHADYWNSNAYYKYISSGTEHISANTDIMVSTLNDVSKLAKLLNSDLVHYADGGINTSTGIAWLDGTPENPEYIFNTEQFNRFKDRINYLPYMTTVASNMFNNGTGNSIGDVTITINEAEINSDYDISVLAQKVGEEFVNNLSEKGFRI